MQNLLTQKSLLKVMEKWRFMFDFDYSCQEERVRFMLVLSGDGHNHIPLSREVELFWSESSIMTHCLGKLVALKCDRCSSC